MATTFDVRLTGGEIEGELRRYAPRDEVAGTVVIIADREILCEHLWVRLHWHTEGRGNRDEGTIGEVDIFQGTLSPGLPISQDFRFELPPSPWSYAGRYISIVWAIQVTVDIPMARDQIHYEPFIVAPRRQAQV